MYPSPRPRRRLASAILGGLALCAADAPCALAQTAAAQSPFAVESRGLTVGLSHFGPRDEFGDSFRDIDITTLDMAIGWRLVSGIEVRAIASAVVARGERAEPFDPAPPRDSDAEGIALGGGLRYHLELTETVDLFAEGAIQFMWTAGTPFPAGGTGVNGLTRWGGGVAVDITPRLTVEAAYLRTHVSNGGGMVDWNPAWNGHGLSVGVRMSF